jgi:putative membrane protein
MRKQMILSSTFLLASALTFAQAPATGGDSKPAPSAIPSPDKSKPTPVKTSTKADDQFAKKAAEGGMAEIEFGKLAVQRSSNPDVKAFGQRMVGDHTKAGDQLKNVAAHESLVLPTEIDAKDKAELARLSKLWGAAFDKAYMTHMVSDHKKDVADFQKEANKGKDDAIRNFAQQTLPTLQDHLKQAEDAQSKVRLESDNVPATKDIRATAHY